ncbi:hypothetical protein R5R35_010400 [Gryllus longicercus]|uniref:CHK kinase-like domain-containing protein n=1 Tax=Gryllus longicercus TaxID=2509291 RepID=A0AAN9VBY9_9ORTH
MVQLSLLSDAEWLSAARRRLEEEGVAGGARATLVGVRAAAGDGEFGGFVGDSLPVRVDVRLPHATAYRELAFFVKALPSDCEVHAQMASTAFHKEAVAYRNLFPAMRALLPGGRTWAPRAYVVRGDALLMEDLMVQGFVERDRRQPFNFAHAAATLEALADFHASAWLLEAELQRETGRPTPLLDRQPDAFAEGLFVEKPTAVIHRWFAGALRGVQKAVQYVPQLKNRPDIDSILERFPIIHAKMVELIKPSTKFKNVMNHGDLWSNNILFRYGNGADALPTDVRLVDFQLVRYVPPAVDINQLLYLTTRPALRAARGGALLRRYHRALAAALARGGACVDAFLPWDELLASCDALRATGLITTPCYHHMSLVGPERFKHHFSPDNFEKFVLEERDELIEECFRDDDYFREKVGEEVLELVEGVLLGKDADFWTRTAQAPDAEAQNVRQ